MVLLRLTRALTGVGGLAGLLLCGPAQATDHWDGPAVKGDATVDLTDFFAFPTQGSTGPRLTLILSVNPKAAPETRFSDVVTYAFRVHRVTKTTAAPTRFLTGPEEVAISCRAERPAGPNLEQWVTCAVEETPQPSRRKASALTSRVQVNDTRGGPEARMRVFAGLRADQSFTDVGRARMPVWREQSLSDKPGVNALAGQNVLSLVVDLDVGAVLGSLGKGSLYAAVAQTSVTRIREGRRETVQLDRMGRLEVTVFMILDDATKDLWNATNTFRPDSRHEPLFRSALQAGLGRLDDFEKSLTGEDVLDWPTPHPFIDMVLDDFLVVDVSKPAKPSSTEPGYLELETAALAGKPHTTCGGRKPNEDVIARTLTLFINGPNRPQPDRGVGVPAPARPAEDTFPYVQPPFVAVEAVMDR
ncbi:hypothetical protein BHS06_04150 [Myxococcus xanthus]|uniref:DUF4331 family protein n=1 Tax=Myxococcus xanthus TaxID=34 RepID=UPI001164B227|nr:DUF4331 family protein [Myxococcus xanthus]QDE88207.1 hypothetical protein BHS06_04150 [Myxococcus xanthus]